MPNFPSDPLTPARLSEIRARAEAATPGPWFEDDQVAGTINGNLQNGRLPESPRTHEEIAQVWDNDGPDTVFIAAARQDVPDLLDEVDRLTAALDIAEKAIDDVRTSKIIQDPRASSGTDRITYYDQDLVDVALADYDAAKEASHE